MLYMILKIAETKCRLPSFPDFRTLLNFKNVVHPNLDLKYLLHFKNVIDSSYFKINKTQKIVDFGIIKALNKVSYYVWLAY